MMVFFHFDVSIFVFVYFRRPKGRQVPPLEEFLRLRSFNVSGEEVFNWFTILLSFSGSLSSAGYVCLFRLRLKAQKI